MLRLIARGQPPAQALFLTLGNFAESAGILTYLGKRLTGTRSRLIEYSRPSRLLPGATKMTKTRMG
ncbi:hypothetical protein ACFSZS_31880 [Seohaeicola zhoushanensis]